jgi:hypothetical protein
MIEGTITYRNPLAPHVKLSVSTKTIAQGWVELHNHQQPFCKFVIVRQGGTGGGEE